MKRGQRQPCASSRVGRTLLSAAFDLDVDLALDFDLSPAPAKNNFKGSGQECPLYPQK
jgi:hypothetical protein